MADLQDLRTGDRLLVCYDLDPEALLWHERLLVGHIGGSEWVIVTPERDVYAEDLILGVEDWHRLGPRGGLPPELRGAPMHRFGQGDPPAAELRELLREGEQLAEAERERYGGADLPALAPEAAPARLAGAGRPAALGDVPMFDHVPRQPPPGPALQPAGGALVAPARAPAGAGGPAWVALEARGGLQLGAPLPGDAAVLARGDRGLATLGNGTVVACGLAGTLAAPAPVAGPAAAGADLRTLPVRYDGAGKRRRDFRECVELFTETTFPDWGVAGPRTVKWLFDEMARWQQAPSQRHHWWRTLLRVSPDDFGVAEHECLSRCFEEAASYDQLNMSELCAFEVLARRFQLIEERYAAKLLEAELGHDSEGRHFETSLFLGGDRSRGRALICPRLEEWISGRLRDEAAILKERRKGREERQLARGTASTPSPGAGAQGAAQPGKKK